jgi:hypothetical protein
MSDIFAKTWNFSKVSIVIETPEGKFLVSNYEFGGSFGMSL